MPPKKEEAPAAVTAGGSKKIFIYELDGYLGKVLGEFAKYKGFAEGETPIICGSLIDPRNKPTWADEVVRKDDLLGLKKALLTSDIIIYDVASTPKEATSALKVLLKYDYAENPEDETDKVMIGVSNLLSWYNTKVPLPGEGEEDRAGGERVLSFEDGPERKPHDNYKAQVTVENLIINKGNCKKDKLQTYVVWAGLLYGCGEGVLHSLFRCSWLPPEEVGSDDAVSLRRAWRTEKKLPILGSGRNTIPMIHVSDLAGMILELAKRRPDDVRSVLAVDKAQTTLAGCVAAISKALQSGEVIPLDQSQYLQFMADFEEPHVNSLLLQLNMKMTLSNGEVLGYGDEDTKWVCKTGFIENIDRVVEEYRKWRNLQPTRILFFGPPTLTWYPLKQLPEGQFLKPEDMHSYAKDFAQEYQVTYIDLEALQQEFKPKEPAEGEEPEAEKSIIEMLQLKMQQPLIRNQGYVLENYPATCEDAQQLFDCDRVSADSEEPPEEDAEGKPPKAPLPQTILNLIVNVPDPAVPPPPAEGEEPAVDSVPTVEMMKAAKLEAYTAVISKRLALLDEATRAQQPPLGDIDAWLTENGTDEEGQQVGCLRLYMTNKPAPEGEAEAAGNGAGTAGPRRQMCEQIVDIVVDYDDLTFIQDKIRLSVGDPRNYDPSKPRREREARAKVLADAQAAAAAAKLKAEEEASRAEREAKAKKDRERLAKLQEEERDALLLRSQPMRKYLMENVLPSLTRGLQEVAKVRPDDPVDYLAEYLFNLDPQLT